MPDEFGCITREEVLSRFTPEERREIKAGAKALHAKCEEMRAAGKTGPDDIVNLDELDITPYLNDPDVLAELDGPPATAPSPRPRPRSRKVHAGKPAAVPLAGLSGWLAGWLNGHGRHAVK